MSISTKSPSGPSEGPSTQVDLADGITLENGETVMLTPSNDSEDVYCTSGTTMSVIYKLDRSAAARVRISGYSDNSGEFDKNITGQTYSGTYKAPHTDNYYVLFTNNSSDDIDLEDFYLIF